MKEYKGKWYIKLFGMFCAFCAGWFVMGLVSKFVGNILVAGVVALVVVVCILYKIFVSDNFSIILTDDRRLLIKRLGNVAKVIDIDKYYWSEYSKYSNTKNVEDQDIYYVDKESGNEEYIDCSNFNSADYDELLTELGAKKENDVPIKVDTVKK